MMPLLYYWQPDNYKRDLDYGAAYHLNQANPLMHSISVGDSLWAFTRLKNGGYALAAQLLVKDKTLNPARFRYGRYRVWGDLKLSRYFDIQQQANAEKILRALSCKTNARLLAQSFQGLSAVRNITSADQMLLAEFARYLPLEKRANILPEDVLEARLVYGGMDQLRHFIKNELPGLGKERLDYLYKTVAKRNQKLVAELQAMYHGKCQICEWAPLDKYGCYICQGHHLQWVCRGGKDTLDNMALLCPNHHQVIHRCDAHFDYKDGSFSFVRHKEPLILNSHIEVIDAA
jgi:5-methylcytosine-specific restriction protein A